MSEVLLYIESLDPEIAENHLTLVTGEGYLAHTKHPPP
jgi:hypothetical protein